MISVLQRVLGNAFEGLAHLGAFDAELRAAREHVDILTDVPYGPHRIAHTLDIYRPTNVPGPLPVMLYIHGGAFMVCSKNTHRALALLNAQRAGYLVFNINYRLAPRHRYPAAIADACTAYAWVLEHAAEYGGDPARCVIAGESAGGNLALGVAIASSYRRPERYARPLFDAPAPLAVMPLMPLLQTSDAARRVHQHGMTRLTLAVLRGIERAYLGASRIAPAALLMADPVRVLEECGAPQRRFPKIFSGVGTADPCYADVRRLALACRELGLPMETVYVRDAGHGFHALHWRRAARRFWRRTIVFLRSVSRLAGVAPIAGPLLLQPAPAAPGNAPVPARQAQPRT